MPKLVESALCYDGIPIFLSIHPQRFHREDILVVGVGDHAVLVSSTTPSTDHATHQLLLNTPSMAS